MNLADVPAAAVQLTPDGLIRSWNRGAERLFGYSASEAIGQQIDALTADHESFREEAIAFTRAHLAGSLQGSGQTSRRTHRDGTFIDVEMSVFQSVGPDDDAPVQFALYWDVSRLERARHHAEQDNAAKSAFLANMSHEIRTPMNGIIGVADLLAETTLTPEQRDYLEIIRSSGDGLLTIVNDILDFSKIESGRVELEQHRFELRDCIEDVLAVMSARAADKDLDLVYELAEGVPRSVVGDQARLRQILLNILSNAIKFTDRGEVSLAVSFVRGDERVRQGIQGVVDRSTVSQDVRRVLNNLMSARARVVARPELQFAVRDTGPGIPASGMARLFRSFSQLDASTSRQYGGTGLGLAISKRLAELMGGTMWAHSEGVGLGSTFTFTVRMTEAEPTPAVNPAPALAGRRVLFVHANAIAARMVGEALRDCELTIESADNADTAEALLRSGKRYDVAIIDGELPDGAGPKLGAEFAKTWSLPVIGVGSLEWRRRATGLHVFAAIVTTPMRSTPMRAALLAIVAGERIDAEAQPQMRERPATETSPLRVLLAEDNAVNRLVAVGMLRRLGFQADVVEDGAEALDAIAARPYDVVLMDVQMAVMGGLEATRRLVAKHPSPDDRPRVVAMTANAMVGDKEVCLAAGMDDYVTKPLRLEAVAAALAACRRRPLGTDLFDDKVAR